MTAYTKRKFWRRAVATIQKTGVVNLPSGSWGRPANGSMGRDMVNGSNHRKVS